jgi:hypothetical protein
MGEKPVVEEVAIRATNNNCEKCYHVKFNLTANANGIPVRALIEASPYQLITYINKKKR